MIFGSNFQVLDMMLRCAVGLGLLCVGLSSGAPIVRADEPVDYVKDIRPILLTKCAQCHGAEKSKANLRLDTAAAAITGGDTGPAIVAGKSAESLLIQAITRAEGVTAMPPKDSPQLTAEEIARLKAWVDQGAKAPAEEPTAAVAKKSSHWSFQPIIRHPLPDVARKEWVRNPIDAFVLARLEKEKLQPAPEADKATLIRRASLDLLGLTPSPAEVDEYLADTKPDAYERMIDRLLASPHYGERWGRHWLDVARYADSNGFTRDFARSIWKYREWVIDAVGRDLPFDQFTIEQFAGDMLPNATMAQRIATGFHRNTLINEEGGTDPEQFRIESVVDRINTTGIAFLGLTVGCAQCHDHKYDPVSQREYYQFFAFLNNADEPQLEVPTKEQEQAGEMQKRDELRKQVTELEKQFKAQEAEFKGALTAWEKSLTDDTKKKLPPLVLNGVNLSLEMRTEENLKELVAYYKGLDEARAKFPVLDQIAKLKAQQPVFITTMIMQERTTPRESFIHVRGDFLRHGAKVTPTVPAVLPPLSAAAAQPNRLDLARWLVSENNPLTARVTINRIWQKYFGHGLVETENDFGVQGSLPTHPELLDWLASEFMHPSVDTGFPTTPWGLKRMHKLIVSSNTYRQSSRHRPELDEVDPTNHLYARQSRVRLDAEIIRDSALSASGLLTRTLGGPSVYPPQPEGVFDFTQDKKVWPTAIGPDRYRRAMYTYLWRSSPYPAMTVFDFPDANVACTRRNRSNTPLQSLTLANDQAFVEFAQGLAARVLKEGPADDAGRLKYAFRLSLTREPSEKEMQRMTAYLAKQKAAFVESPAEADNLAPRLLGVKATVPEFAAWTSVARVLLNLDEFITRE